MNVRRRSSSAATGRTTSAYLVRRLQDAGFVIVGMTTHAGVRDPPDHRAARGRPDAQPVGHRRARPAARPAARRRRSPRACCRSRTATTAAARLRIPAACCGLVGPQAQPRPRVARRRPRRLLPRLRRRAHPHGGRDGGAARRARRLRGRRRDLGAAPRRAATRPPCAATRAGCAIAMTAENAFGRRTSTPNACAAMRETADAARPARARGRRGVAGAAGQGHAAPVHRRVRARDRAPAVLRRAAGRPAAGGGRDRAAVARDLRPARAGCRRSSTSPASRSCRRWRAAWWRSSPSTTCCSRPRWPSAR